MLVQVLERGSHYLTVTTRGAELQETTVCHDEENGNINELAEEIFEKRLCCKPNFLFSLSPLKQIHFDLYQDLKYSLAGSITSPQFADMVKQYFTRIFAYKLAKLLLKEDRALPQIFEGGYLQSEDLEVVNRFKCQQWLAYLHVTDKFVATRKPNQKVASSPKKALAKKKQPQSYLDQLRQSQENFEVNQNANAPPQVVRAAGFASNFNSNPPIRLGTGQSNRSFVLDQGRAAHEISLNSGVQDKRGKPGRMAEDNFLNDLEDMLDDNPKPATNAYTDPKKESVGGFQKKKPPPSTELEDLDDLDDFGANKGLRNRNNIASPTDLDDLDDMIGGIGQTKAENSRQGFRSGARRTSDNATDVTQAGNNHLPEGISGVARFDLSKNEAPKATFGNSFGKAKNNIGGSQERLVINQLLGSTPFWKYVQEAYCAIFKDEFVGFPIAIFNIFNGKIQKS